MKCIRCKKEFDFIDANNHCIDCWEKLQYEPDMNLKDKFVSAWGDFIGWLLRFKDPYTNRALKNPDPKSDCICVEIRNYTGVK